MIQSLFDDYLLARATPSDIYLHLEKLHELAMNCESVTEFGVRDGHSTRAFLAADCKLRSFDLYIEPTVDELFQRARAQGKDCQYLIGNTLNITIEETDLLFIDSLHTYTQLMQELNLHAHKVRKYLAFHDTHTFGLHGENPNDHRGLLTAIIEFLIQNKDWEIFYSTYLNNGLMILKRKGS